MSKRLSSLPFAWLWEVVRQARLAWRLLWDRRVPVLPKLILPVVLVYILIPVDILPDFVLGLGQLDDLALLLLAIKLFIVLCPSHLVREHLMELGVRVEEWQPGEVIEGEFRITQSEEGRE